MAYNFALLVVLISIIVLIISDSAAWVLPKAKIV